MVNWLSRSDVDPAEWPLNSSMILLVQEKFRRPIIDQFASPSNNKVHQFLSLFPPKEAEEDDSLIDSLLASRSALHLCISYDAVIPLYWPRGQPVSGHSDCRNVERKSAFAHPSILSAVN